MAQKAPILLYNEANMAFINTVNYFIQQGVSLHEMQNVIANLHRDLDALVEQELKKAQEEYQAAMAKEEAAANTETIEENKAE